MGNKMKETLASRVINKLSRSLMTNAGLNVNAKIISGSIARVEMIKGNIRIRLQVSFTEPTLENNITELVGTIISNSPKFGSDKSITQMDLISKDIHKLFTNPRSDKLNIDKRFCNAKL